MAADAQRGEAVLARAQLAPPSGAAARSTRSTGRRRIESSPSSVNAAPLLRGQPARQQPQQRAGVADVDRRVRLAAPRAARCRARRCSSSCDLHERSQRAHGVERRVGVGGVQIALDPHRLGGHRAEQRGAMRDRLVGRRPQLAGQSAERARSACSWAPPHARTTGKPRRDDQLAGAPRRLLAGDPQRDRRPGCCRARATGRDRRC